MGIFSYTSRAGFIYVWGVSLTHPVLASFLSGEFLLHIPCWLHFYARSFTCTSRTSFIFYLRSFSYTPMLAYFFLFFFLWGVCLTHPEFLSLSLMWWFSLTHPMLASFLSVEFLSHIPCWLYFDQRTFSDRSDAGFLFIGVVGFTHPVLSSFVCGEFVLHIRCWLYFHVESFSYTSPAGFIFIWGVSLTHPMLDLVFCGEFLLHIPCWLFFFKSGEFFLHIPCWLHFYLGTFS